MTVINLSRLRSTGPRTLVSTLSLALLAAMGCGSGGSTSSAPVTPTAATPTFSPAAGSYASDQTITISDGTTGTTIYYSTTGGTPSTVYKQPFTISATTTVTAFASATGYNNSATATATYTLNLPPEPTPVITPGTGTYTGVQTVTISDTGADSPAIWYTTDGSKPGNGTGTSMLYTQPITVSVAETINAVAIGTATNSTSNSAEATAVYTFTAAPTCTFLPAGGTYSTVQTVSLSSSVGGSIYYTTDGTAPSVGTGTTQLYSTQLTIASTTMVNCIVTAPGYSTSPQGSATYTINFPPFPTVPTISPASGTYPSSQTVTIMDAGASTIYYTEDNSAPSATNPTARIYTQPFSVTATMTPGSTTTTVKAAAIAADYTLSGTATAIYTINLPATCNPTISPASGSYLSTQLITITDTCQSGTSSIYYTTDGTPATVASTPYTAPFALGMSEKVNAIAVASGYSASSDVQATYTVTQVATPTFSPAGSTTPFTTVQYVTIMDGTAANASIYYTTNGNPATTASTPYTGAITVSSSETINAIAVLAGYTNSADASASYTINLPTAAACTINPVSGNETGPVTVTLSDASTSSGANIYYTTDGSKPTVSSTDEYTAPFTVSKTTTVNCIAGGTNFITSAEDSATYTYGPTMVTVVLTTDDGKNEMAPQTAVAFGTSAVAADQIVVDETQTYQTMDGFGAAFTDTSGYVLEHEALTSQLSTTINNLFTRTGTGIGISFMRLPMGASDLARSQYTYDDNGGAADPTLANFSIAHDQTEGILPLVQAAKTANPDLKIMANPWSPPAWMKTPANLDGGYLNSTYYTPWANYFVKFVTAYENAGVPIDYLSIQNEPLYNTDNSDYPGMYIDDDTAANLITKYMLPALTAATFPSTTPKLFLYDHNTDSQDYPTDELSYSAIAQSPLVAGVAWHGYASPLVYGVLGSVQNIETGLNPALGTWETEHAGFSGNSLKAQLTSDMLEISQVVRNAGKGYLKWPIATDQNDGPNLTTSGNGMGCTTCDGLVTVNSASGQVTYNIDYYTIGHFSKYVLPGAKYIYSTNGIYTNSAAFLNPDGSKALVVFNNSSSTQSFQVQWGTQNFTYSLPGDAAATFSWSGTQNGPSYITAKNETQTSDYVTMSGIETEFTSDTSGAYDVGYVTNNANLFFQNVNFGTTSPTKISVRNASDGNGGTLVVHEDSLTGTVLATVTLANTGGYQTWATTTQALSTTITGIHKLYFVIEGSGGIANLNWFQFQ